MIDTNKIRAKLLGPSPQSLGGDEVLALCEEIDRLYGMIDDIADSDMDAPEVASLYASTLGYERRIETMIDDTRRQFRGALDRLADR